jgi:hypothetical protein
MTTGAAAVLGSASRPVVNRHRRADYGSIGRRSISAGNSSLKIAQAWALRRQQQSVRRWLAPAMSFSEEPAHATVRSAREAKMIVGRTVSFRPIAMLPEAQRGSPGQPPQPGNLPSTVDWKTLAEGITPGPQGGMAAPTAAWQRLRDPMTDFTAYLGPSDSKTIFTDGPNFNDIVRGWKPIAPNTPQATARIGRIYCPQLDVTAVTSRGLKPIAPDTAQVPAPRSIGDLPFKRVSEARGLLITKSAYQILYFSNTVPPDQLAVLLQNYGALTPDAAHYCANSLLSCLSSPAGHAVLYGLMATGGGIFLLEATHEKPTLPEAFRWAIYFFVAGVLFYLGVRYLGWVK